MHSWGRAAYYFTITVAAATLLWVAGSPQRGVGSTAIKPPSNHVAARPALPRHPPARQHAAPAASPDTTVQANAAAAVQVPQAAIASIHAARTNVLLPPRIALENALARNDALIADTVHMLAQLDEAVLADPNSPEADALIRGRMAAMDVLEIAAQEAVTLDSAAQAVEALQSIALGHTAAPRTDSGKRVRISERYDAFVALGRVDPQLAVRRLQDIANPNQRAFFRRGVAAAALDQGVPRHKLEAYMAALEGDS